MKIKGRQTLKRLASRLWGTQYKRDRSLKFLGLFLSYNVLIGLAIWIFFSRGVTEQFREEVLDRIEIMKIPSNFIKGKTAIPPKLEIDIKHSNLQKLAYVRAMSLKRGFLHDSEENDVPATIRYKGDSYRVNLSLKGILRSHWEDEEMYSLKVKAKGSKTIMGMKSFALQHPSTRNYINEWVLHQLFAEAGIMSLRYDFVSVNINGKGSRIYALEEGFEKRLVENNKLKEGPMLKFETGALRKNRTTDSVFTIGIPQNLWRTCITPIPRNSSLADTIMSPLFDKARSLMEAFRQNKLTTSQVFDVPKLATFFALGELFGSHHLASLPNIRFYYNPITSLLEPITHDNDHLDHLRYHGLLGAEKVVGKDIQFREYGGWWKRTNWYEAVFKDQIFYEAYVGALIKVSEKEYLDSFFDRQSDLFHQEQKVLHRDYPLFKLDPSEILYENQAYIRELLDQENLIQIYCDKIEPTSQKVSIMLANVCDLPIEIIEARLGKSPPLKMVSRSNIIQPHIRSEELPMSTFQFELPDNADLRQLADKKMIIKHRILGAKEIREKKHPLCVSTADKASDPVTVRIKTSPSDYDFLIVDELQNLIHVKPGKYQIAEDLVIPRGYQWFVAEGTTIDLINHAKILSNSPIYFIGSSEKPITFYSSDSTARGITVLNVEEESQLQYVHFDNLVNLPSTGMPGRSTVTFANAPVNIDHCFFGNNEGWKSYLSLIGCSYYISNSVFYRSGVTALQADFCDGEIVNCQFAKAGEEAISIVGSKLTLRNSSIKNSGRLAMVASDKSTAILHNVSISNTGLGLVSRDLSSLNVKGINLKNCQIEFAVMQDNNDFGPASIELEDISNNYKPICWIDNESVLKSGGRKFKSNIQRSEVMKLINAN